jgi:hypothetical protein
VFTEASVLIGFVRESGPTTAPKNAGPDFPSG